MATVPGGAVVDPRERAHLRRSLGESPGSQEVQGPGGGSQQEDVWRLGDDLDDFW